MNVPGSDASAASTAAPLTDWAVDDLRRLGQATISAPHRLSGLAVFSDAALSEALDCHPRSDLQIFTMGAEAPRSDAPGSDASRSASGETGPGDWTPVEPGDADGAGLLKAVRAGRLWLNILRIDRSDARFGDLQVRLFDEIATVRDDLEPGSPRSTLLISSPGAQVYFHMDAGPNVLWHIHGNKRVWVYPARDDALVPRHMREDIFAGVRTENLPYEPEFDATADVRDLVPGDALAWAQNSPHRIENLDAVNVSLSCEFATEESRRREYTVLANRFLGRGLHLPARSEREDGTVAAAKRFAYRAARKLHVEHTRPHYEYETDLRIDPDAADGLARLPERRLTSFSVT